MSHPPLPPDQRKPRKGGRKIHRPPAPELAEAAASTLTEWAALLNWPAPRPGWQRNLARALDVRPDDVSRAFRGVRPMPLSWGARFSDYLARPTGSADSAPSPPAA